MAGSLADRVAARREERVAKRSQRFIVHVPGYRDLLAARYRPLEFEEKRRIQLGHAGIGEDAHDEVAASADLLIHACEELLEVSGVDDAGETVYRPLGEKWSSASISDLFGVNNPSVRQALIAALGSEDVMTHFGEYAQDAARILDEGEEAAQGESQPSVEG